MLKLFDALVSFSDTVYNHFSKLDTLTWEGFLLTLKYEVLIIAVVVLIVLFTMLCCIVLCLPMFIGQIIQYAMMRHYATCNKSLCKIHMLYPLNKLKNDLDWLTTNGGSIYSVRNLYKRWCIIRRFNFLPEQQEFDKLLKSHKTALHKDAYCKILADFISTHAYVPYVRSLYDVIQPVEEHVCEKMLPINIILWILWALLLIPVAIPLLL